MRETPTTLPGETRRNRAPHRNRVLLVSPDGGEIREGQLRVSKKLAEAEPHTNDWHLLKATMRSYLTDYYRWLEKKGYKLMEKPVIDGPWPLFVGKKVHKNLSHAITNSDGEAEEEVYFRVRSRMRLVVPMYISTEDYWERLRVAQRYGIDINDMSGTVMPENELPDGVDNIDATDEEAIDPLKFRAERWEKLGIKPGEYLAPSIEDWHGN